MVELGAVIIVLVGVKLSEVMVGMEGVIVIAEGSCNELLLMDSPFVLMIALDAVVVNDGTGVVFVTTLALIVDLVGVIGVVETVEMIALLLNLFAKRLLISVEVLVVGIGREPELELVVVEEVDVFEVLLMIRMLLQLVLVLVLTVGVEVLLFFGGALRCALRMGDISCEVGV